jgi:hypothetical protein
MYRAQVEVTLMTQGDKKHTVKRKDLNFTVQVNNPGGIKAVALAYFIDRYAEYRVRTVSLTGRASGILYCTPEGANRTGRQLAQKGFPYKRLVKRNVRQ